METVSREAVDATAVRCPDGPSAEEMQAAIVDAVAAAY